MAEPENEEPIFDASMKKKKKKKKTTFDLEQALAGTPQTAEESAGATETQNTDQTNGESTLDMKDVKEALPSEKDEGDDDPELDLDFGSKKKKKKGVKRVQIDDKALTLGSDEPAVHKVTEGEYALTDEDYTYDQLLNRVFTIMREKNPDMQSGGKRRYVSKPPLLARVGTKKTAFTNFGDICKQMKRQTKHLLQFLLAELGTSGNVDANDSLILKGRYQQKHIETVLRRYIKEYVTCHTCTSPDTILEREIRLFFLTCQNCGSRSSVASIKSGFQAVTGKRAAMRAKTA